jgi:hypothetical protein
MPAQDFFTRLMPRFALQAGEAKKTAGRQADAERLISKAEYECVQTRRDLVAAFAVPLSHRAVKVEIVEAAEPAGEAEATPASGAAKAA